MSHTQYSGSANPQGGGRRHRRKRRPSRARRDNKAASLPVHPAPVPSIAAGVQSNPRRNRHWRGDEEAQQGAFDYDSNEGREVTKAKASAKKAASDQSTQPTETSSASFASFDTSNIDCGSVGGPFHVASVGSGSHFSEHDQGNPEAEEEAGGRRGDNMPGHWHWRTAGRAGASGGGLLGRIREARPPKASPRISRSLDLSSDSDCDFSVASRSIQSDGSSKLWDQMESKGDTMEAEAERRSRSIAAREEETRRRRATRGALRARQCVGFLTMAALSVTAGYFIVEQLFSPPSQMMTVATFFDVLFGGDGDSKEAEGVSRLRYRQLPQSVQQETVAAAPQEDGISPRELDHAARHKRVHARTERRRRARAAQRQGQGQGQGQGVHNKGVSLQERKRREHIAKMNEKWGKP